MSADRVPGVLVVVIDVAGMQNMPPLNDVSPLHFCSLVEHLFENTT